MEDDKNSAPRGYDDNAHLKEMADGIISRRFSSVDEAARAVLCEDPGSNVDRLRRKFREQGWYERGLNDYVEAEIARRGEKIEELPHDYLFNSNGTPKTPLETRLLVMQRDIYRGLTPRGPLSFVLFGAMAFLLSARVTDVEIGDCALIVLTVIAIAGMFNWAKDAAQKQGTGLFARHLGALLAMFMFVAMVFRYSMPDSAYTTGSLAGSVTLAVAGLVMTSYLVLKADVACKREGRKHSLESEVLTVVLFLLSVLAMAQVPIGITRATTRDDTVKTATVRMEDALTDLLKANPSIDIESVRRAQVDALKATAKAPQW